MAQIRTRIAPSPTGEPHVGTAYIALFNRCFAHQHGGKFILRVEDTDQVRSTAKSEQRILDSLNWLGLDWDEGPDRGGEFEPYRQSERAHIYTQHIDHLLEEKKVFRCFCSSSRLSQLRQNQMEKKQQPGYDGHCLKFTDQQIAEKLEKREKYVIRMTKPETGECVFQDYLRGEVRIGWNQVDMQILIKSDGLPTYHFANVVDDHLMGITHVIRGEEWLSSTPKHILLYNALGWELPKFAHLPLLLNADRSKLSKRQGDVAVEDYKAKGYLKEALLNFVALLGWSTSDNDEIFSLDELIENFSLERVHKAGAIFNVEKLDWLNAEHLRKKDKNEILLMVKEELSKSKYKDLELTDEYLLSIISAMIERVSFVREFIDNSPYFFERPTSYDEAVIKKRWKDDSVELLEKYVEKLSKLENPKKEDFEIALKQVAEEAECGAGRIIHPARVATSGVGIGPGVYDLLFILGKDEVIERINNALKIIPEIKERISQQQN